VLPSHEEEKGGDERPEKREYGDRAPTPFVALNDGKGETEESGCRQAYARQIEPGLPALMMGVRHEKKGHHPGGYAQRDVHEEDPVPGEVPR